MGYSTYFENGFKFNKPVSTEFKNYINEFSLSRRMIRDNDMIKSMYPDWSERCFNGELGVDGEYFVENTVDNPFGLFDNKSILDVNTPPKTQPGLWCQWIISEDGTTLEWDGGEKFYHYTEWLEYLIKNFIEPSGYILNGTVDWYDDYEDCGRIKVIDNVISNI